MRYTLPVNPPRPLYFPVKSEPLRMQAGLFRFGTDFGNGDADRSFFPRDATSAHYLAQKARVLAQQPTRDACSVRDADDEAAVAAAEAWFRATLSAEGQGLGADVERARLGARLMEDFAVLRRDAAGADRVVWLHACFPSGWRAEQVLGQSFAQIHANIPAIERVAQKSQSLVDAMLTRGPFVRFVWTISADAELDHHPDHGQRQAWSASTQRGFLRVERQTTVPLPPAATSVFLIRTYLYDFDELSPEQRGTLAMALQCLPPDIARYKQLTTALPRALELLR